MFVLGETSALAVVVGERVDLGSVVCVAVDEAAARVRLSADLSRVDLTCDALARVLHLPHERLALLLVGEWRL